MEWCIDIFVGSSSKNNGVNFTSNARLLEKYGKIIAYQILL